VEGQIIPICKRLCATLALLSASSASAADAPIDAYWQARRSELSGHGDGALKRYNSLLAKAPGSEVAADRLLETAIVEGDMKSALKAVRAQQLANVADEESALLLFVDAWQRKNGQQIDFAITELSKGRRFSFVAQLLSAWKNVTAGKDSGLTTAKLRADPMLGYYAGDQLVYLDLASGNMNGAKERLRRVQGYSEDFGRHLILLSIPQFAASGDRDFAMALAQQIGLPSTTVSGRPSRLSQQKLAEWAIAAHFSRLSDQLQSQNLEKEALYFARLAHWMAPTSEVARMTLAQRVESAGRNVVADSLLSSISLQSVYWPWVQRERAVMLNARGNRKGALALVQAAKAQSQLSGDMILLEAQLLDDGGDYAAAVDGYRQVIAAALTRKAEGRERAYYSLLLAQALEKSGNWNAARTELETALTLDANNPQLLNYLGYSILERREDVKRGFEMVRKAHGLVPDSPAITDSLGWGYYLNKQYDKAIPLLEQAVAKALGDVVINEHLGDAYWKAGRKIEARYAWRAATVQAKDDIAKRLENKLDLGLNDKNAAP
jgi:tetratricopeptide (TPR) repeat protein